MGVYTCESFEIPVLGMVTIELAWILVRDPTNVTDDVMAQAFAAYTDQGLDTVGFMPVSQENCTYENPTGAAECTGGNWNGTDPKATPEADFETKDSRYYGGWGGYYGHPYGYGYRYGWG